MSKKQFNVLSPDGFSIHHTDTYDTIEQAYEAMQQWAKRYKSQGYYSSVKYGRIPIQDLDRYCSITIEIETINN